MTDEIFMTAEQAEEIVMANAVGMFHGRPSELAHAILLMGKATRIGDGTAPDGFPAYSQWPHDGVSGVVCRFNGCGHTGTSGATAKMHCGGKTCACPCCRMLAGDVVFGCTYGGG